jgi:hypothetical protein
MSSFEDLIPDQEYESDTSVVSKTPQKSSIKKNNKENLRDSFTMDVNESSNKFSWTEYLRMFIIGFLSMLIALFIGQWKKINERDIKFKFGAQMLTYVSSNLILGGLSYFGIFGN